MSSPRLIERLKPGIAFYDEPEPVRWQPATGAITAIVFYGFILALVAFGLWLLRIII